MREGGEVPTEERPSPMGTCLGGIGLGLPGFGAWANALSSIRKRKIGRRPPTWAKSERKFWGAIAGRGVFLGPGGRHLTANGSSRLRRVAHDEVHHGLGIVEAVGVVADAGLVDDFDFAAELPVALLDDVGVFGGDHDVIGIADDVDDGHFRLGERLQGIHGIALVGEGFLVVFETIGLRQIAPFHGAAFAIAVATEDGSEIAQRRIAIDDGDGFRALAGKAVGIHAAAAEADEGTFFGEAVGDEEVVEGIEMLHGFRSAKGVAHHDVDVVKTGGEQLRRGASLGEGVREFHAPGPGIARQGFLGFDDPGGAAVGFKLVAFEALPLVGGFVGE